MGWVWDRCLGLHYKTLRLRRALLWSGSSSKRSSWYQCLLGGALVVCLLGLVGFGWVWLCSCSCSCSCFAHWLAGWCSSSRKNYYRCGAGHPRVTLHCRDLPGTCLCHYFPGKTWSNTVLEDTGQKGKYQKYDQDSPFILARFSPLQTCFFSSGFGIPLLQAWTSSLDVRGPALLLLFARVP